MTAAAERLRQTYEPKDPEWFDAMCSVLSEAPSKKMLERMAVLYIFDEVFSAADIVTAVSYVKKLKGWD